MEKEREFIKFCNFREWYQRIHYLEGGSNPEHRRAAESLYQGSLEFLKKLPLGKIQKVLDVGIGYGYHCRWFRQQGLDTTGIATQLSAEIRSDAIQSGYQALAMDLHFLDFADHTFDLVWSHHSLEHSFSPLLALREWHRVLKPEGWLAVTVPPHKSQIVSGHFNVGWSLGQLIYLLGITGYQLRGGIFLQQGYNVRALVVKPSQDRVYDGISWLHKLKDHLPEFVKLKEAPKSLGRFYYDAG